MRSWLAVPCIAMAIGCEPTRGHPWDQGDAAPTMSKPPPDAIRDAGSETASVLPDASLVPVDPADEAPPPTPPVRVGGPWVRCYGSFHPSGDPVKDVTRLALLCGPENGMKRLSRAPIEGAVSEGGPAVTSAIEARRGECYRVFAVSGPGVTDLDVVVKSSRGASVAADHGEDAWPVVQPDRPFCPFEDDRYSIEISARRGSGRFAAEVWVLRTVKKPN